MFETRTTNFEGYAPSFAEAEASSFPCLSNDAIKVVVIGSSTAEGHGVDKKDSWVGRYKSYLQNINPDNEVINLAKGGYTTYHLLPDGSKTPTGYEVDPERNITQAISKHPDAILINLPSNDTWDGFGKEIQMANFKIMYDLAQENGIPVWITTTQPRDQNLDDDKLAIQLAVRDAIEETYGEYALDFWTGIATSEGRIKPEYYLAAEKVGKNIHVNAEGHKVLFQEVVNQKVYEKAQGLKYHLFTSVKSGDFSNKSTWNLHAIPGNDATIIIQANQTVSLSQDASVKAVKIEENGKLDLNTYQLTASCNWDIQGTLDAAQATLALTGSEDITLEGFTAVKNLTVNKSGGAVHLSKNLTVNGALELTDGPVVLDGHNLTVEKPLSLKGGAAGSYVQTTGQGELIFMVDNGIKNKALDFPVGDNKHYTPFTFVLKSGSVASNGKLSMTVTDAVPPQANDADPILSRYWQLNQEGLSDYLYNVKYQYLDEDVENGGDEKALKVIKYSDEEGWLIGGQVNAGTNTLFADGISSFSTFSGGNNIDGASPLPVRLLSFQVRPTEEGDAMLTWQTASELHNDYFAIERSADAEQWTSIGQVKGGGNSNDLLSYSFADPFPLSGNSYYRLKQVDFDGKFEYSSVVSFYSDRPVRFNVTLSPNPVQAREGLVLQLVTPEPEIKATVEIYDILGRLYSSEEIKPQQEITNLTLEKLLKPGLYLVTVRQGYQVIQKKLLVY